MGPLPPPLGPLRAREVAGRRPQAEWWPFAQVYPGLRTRVEDVVDKERKLLTTVLLGYTASDPSLLVSASHGPCAASDGAGGHWLQLWRLPCARGRGPAVRVGLCPLFRVAGEGGGDGTGGWAGQAGAVDGGSSDGGSDGGAEEDEGEAMLVEVVDAPGAGFLAVYGTPTDAEHAEDATVRTLVTLVPLPPPALGATPARLRPHTLAVTVDAGGALERWRARGREVAAASGGGVLAVSGAEAVCLVAARVNLCPGGAGQPPTPPTLAMTTTALARLEVEAFVRARLLPACPPPARLLDFRAAVHAVRGGPGPPAALLRLSVVALEPGSPDGHGAGRGRLRVRRALVRLAPGGRADVAAADGAGRVVPGNADAGALADASVGDAAWLGWDARRRGRARGLRAGLPSLSSLSLPPSLPPGPRRPPRAHASAPAVLTNAPAVLEGESLAALDHPWAPVGLAGWARAPPGA